MEKENIINSLKLFNEKADKLISLNFTKAILGGGSGFKIFWEKGGPIEFRRKGPEGDSVDAFVLTYRFFIQNNERISFQRMAKIYDEIVITDEKKKAFEGIRESINNFLDLPSIVTTIRPKQGNGKTYTFREIQDIFIYGGLSHANKDKKRIFDSWKGNPLLFGMLENEFVYVLGNILNAIKAIKKLNLDVLKEIEQ